MLPGHWGTINLHLDLAAPSDRVPLTAHNNTQNAAGPCRPSLICGCRPGVEFNCCWLLDLPHFVGRLATSFSLHTGQNQWADMQRATPQQGSPAQTGRCVCVHPAHTHTLTLMDRWKHEGNIGVGERSRWWGDRLWKRGIMEKGTCLTVCFGVLCLHSGHSSYIVHMEISVTSGRAAAYDQGEIVALPGWITVTNVKHFLPKFIEGCIVWSVWI